MSEHYIKNKVIDFMKPKKKPDASRKEKYDIRWKVMKYVSTKRIIWFINKELDEEFSLLKQRINKKVREIIEHELK